MEPSVILHGHLGSISILTAATGVHSILYSILYSIVYVEYEMNVCAANMTYAWNMELSQTNGSILKLFLTPLRSSDRMFDVIPDKTESESPP